MQSSHAKEINPQSSNAFSDVVNLLSKAVDDQVFPGCVLLAARGGITRFQGAFGARTYKSGKNDAPLPMTLDTVFDIGELTAPVVTTTILMKLVESGKVRLDDRVARYVQGFGVHGKSAITVGDLLAHTSGLVNWHPFHQELLDQQGGARRGIMTSRGARDYIVNMINRMEPRLAAGAKQVYSDVGLIMLGYLVEVLTGLSLDRAAQRFLFQPLNLKSTSYVDISMIKRRGIHPVTDMIAPTEDCQWRGRVLCGEVQDDNAWVMGGIAGHAGLFSCAADLHSFASAMIASWRTGTDYLGREVLQLFWNGSASFPDGRRYGWDSPNRENGLEEVGFTRNAVGCNSFTGCSLWLEPEEGLSILLLSNRLYPNRSNRKIQNLRPELLSLTLKALRGQ